MLGGAETCDDGNTTAGDGCDATCLLEPGWACPLLGKRCQAAMCNDGILAGFEECEDGNALPGDGCDEDCQSECDPDPRSQGYWHRQCLGLSAADGNLYISLENGHVMCLK